MHVDVEDRGPPPGAQQPLRRDGRVVEETEAARHVGEGVVPRRAAQRIGRARPVHHHVGAGHRGLRRPVGGLPGVLGDRAGGVGLVVARLPHGGFRVAVATGWPGGCSGITSSPAPVDALPAGVDRAQEGQVFGACGSRRSAPSRHRAAPRSRSPPPRAPSLRRADALGLLGVRLDRAVRHEMPRVVPPLPLVEYGLHVSSFRACRSSGPSSAMASSLMATWAKPSRS